VGVIPHPIDFNKNILGDIQRVFPPIGGTDNRTYLIK
jgi:hypothetical protein